MQIGFIGLGNMGYPMAGHIAKNNYQLTVYNRSTEKSRKWGLQYKSKVATTYEELIKSSDILILCVSRDEDVYNIITGDYGVYNNMKNGGIVIDHTTTSSTIACQMKGLLDKKISLF